MKTNGILIIDKPIGPTSFDIIRILRRQFPDLKIGHAGSLDPFASGVLLLLLGKATSLSDALMRGDKTYECRLRLGDRTDSYDCTGVVTQQADIPILDIQEIDKVLQSFQGEWQQIPPMFSAKKQSGVRLYTLARQNILVPREPVPVQIYSIQLSHYQCPDIFFKVHCSKGTYVRSLADEIAIKLGTYGHLSALRRTVCGPYAIEKAWTVEQVRLDPQGALLEAFENYKQWILASNFVTARKDPHLQIQFNNDR